MNSSQFDGLPGADLIRRGVVDLRASRTTPESLLVAMAAPRLQALGVLANGEGANISDAELGLYELLGEMGARDPYSRYNALRRELSSFLRALEQRLERESAVTSTRST